MGLRRDFVFQLIWNFNGREGMITFKNIFLRVIKEITKLVRSVSRCMSLQASKELVITE